MWRASGAQAVPPYAWIKSAMHDDGYSHAHAPNAQEHSNTGSWRYALEGLDSVVTFARAKRK